MIGVDLTHRLYGHLGCVVVEIGACPQLFVAEETIYVN
jgi:hypothetical protein